MSKKNIINLFFVFCFLLTNSISEAKYLYKEIDQSTAEKAGKVLEEKKFFIYFCSNCSPEEANIRRINIGEIEILINNEGKYSLLTKGQIVRGIKPPVFGGYCTDHLTIYSPSIPLELPYEHEIDLANTYVWDKETMKFVNVAVILGLDTNNICVKSLELTK